MITCESESSTIVTMRASHPETLFHVAICAGAHNYIDGTRISPGQFLHSFNRCKRMKSKTNRPVDARGDYVRLIQL